MTAITADELHKRIPENLRNVVNGLLNLGFKVSYVGPSRSPAKADQRTRGRVDARKNGVRLVAVVSWIGPGRSSSVHLYAIESVGGQTPNLSARGMKTFWKLAKGA